MKQAILDSNFIITCVKQKLDFFEELEFMGFRVVVPKQVIKELERLEKTKRGAIKLNVELALKVLRSNMPKLIDLETNYVDRGIVNYLRKNKDVVVATLDAELKKKIKSNKVVIRGKKRLEVV